MNAQRLPECLVYVPSLLRLTQRSLFYVSVETLRRAVNITLYLEILCLKTVRHAVRCTRVETLRVPEGLTSQIEAGKTAVQREGPRRTVAC
jgi:hypothetical protein